MNPSVLAFSISVRTGHVRDDNRRILAAPASRMDGSPIDSSGSRPVANDGLIPLAFASDSSEAKAARRRQLKPMPVDADTIGHFQCPMV